MEKYKNDPRSAKAADELINIIRNTPPSVADYYRALFNGACHGYCIGLLPQLHALQTQYRDIMSLQYLTPTYVGPIRIFLDHGVIAVNLDGHTFYIDRMLYGGSDRIFFEWPDDLLYPGSQKEKEYNDKEKEYNDAAEEFRRKMNEMLKNAYDHGIY